MLYEVITQFHDKLIEYGLMEKVLVLEERVKNLSEELDEFKLQVLSGKIKS